MLIEITLPALNAFQRHSKHVTYIISDISIAYEKQNVVFYVFADMPKDHTCDKQQWNDLKWLSDRSRP